MKAALLVGPRRIEIQEVSRPSLPMQGLLVVVRACGICGSDIRRWLEGPPKPGQPILMGHEIAGDVIESDCEQSGFQVGDRVAIAPDVHCGQCYFCDRGIYNLCDNLRLIGVDSAYPGGFAELMPFSENMVRNGVIHRIPGSLTYAQAALAEPLSSVLAAQDKARIGLGDTIVIMGAGPIGCLHLLVAHARGARAILSEPSAARRKLAERFKPEFLVDPNNQDLISCVKDLSAGRGADVVICANPAHSSQTQAIEVVRKGGMVILFGGLPKANSLTVMDANRIHYGEIRVQGSFSYHPSYHALALETLENRLVDSEGIITHAVSLDEIDAGFQIASGGESLKVMVDSGS